MFSRRNRILDFHRPQKLGLTIPLNPESLQCLRNLSKYQRLKSHHRFPKRRSAAVVVALFIGREGDIYVLLNRRSDDLRSYPGDTSLPGGKRERGDRSIENAARREAFEEIGLPLDRSKVPLLCILEPFLAGNNIIVTPVVVLVLDPTLRPILNRSEVQSIFSHPLKGFLTTAPIREPEPHPWQGESSTGSQADITEAPYTPECSRFPENPEKRPYHTQRDIPWNGTTVRMHSFLTGREAQGVKPVFGLTASIMIRVAQLGYGRDPDFELFVPGQASMDERIAYAMKHNDNLRDACIAEGLEKDWGIEVSTTKEKGKERGRL